MSSAQAAADPTLRCFTFPWEHMGSTNTVPSSTSIPNPKISHYNTDLEACKPFICKEAAIQAFSGSYVQAQAKQSGSTRAAAP